MSTKNLRLLLVPALAIAAVSAHAQGGSAVVSGTVADATGAVVSDSNIILTNTGTGLKLNAKSNESGLYQLPNVPPGDYTLTVEHDGFRRYEQKGIHLAVSQQATLPVALTVGGSDQTVDVVADAVLLNVTNAEVSNTVGEKAVRELPLNGRDPSSLVLLSPGIVNILNTSAGTLQNQTTFPGESGASAGGGRQGSTLYLLDGVPNMDTYMLLAAPNPNADATSEFRIISNNFDAHYGFSPGAVVSINTKSGTNDFHGGAFEFIRNSALNSANYFSHAVDSLKRNQFGGFLGGPVIKDRLFFFGNYQQTRQSSTSTGNSVNLPTQAMLNGDFSSYSGTLRTPFATSGGKTNQINPAQYDPAALAIARTVFPLATNASGLYYYTTPKTVEVYHEGTGRLDYTVNDKHRLALRSFIQYYNRPAAVTAGNALAAVTAKQGKLFNEVLNHTWMISPTTVNDISVFWGQVNVATSAPTLTASGQQFCLSQVATISDPTGQCYMGTFTVTGGFSASNSGFTGERRNNYGVNENFTKTIGNHTISAGGAFWHQWARELTSYPANAIPTFSGYYTGLGLADYLLGKAGTFLQGAGELAEVSGNVAGLFVQDQARLTPKLTVTAGLRWDPNLMPNAKDGRGSVYNPGQQSTLYPNAPRGLVFPGDAGVPQSLASSSYRYYEPRIAVAYQATPKTAIRAGFGMFTAPLPYSIYNHTVDVSPFSPTYTLTATLTTSPIQLSNPWANYAATSNKSPFPPFVYDGTKPTSSFNFGSQTSVSATFSPNFKLGMTQSWNVSLEQQFGHDFALHLAYVGSQSYHQTTGIDLNAGQTAAAVRGVRSNAAFGQLVAIQSFGTANYHSLQAQLEKHMSHGLQFQSSFTWSKTEDIISSGNVTFAKAYLPNPYNVRYNRGISQLNIPLNSVTNLVYTTPTLRGHSALVRNVFGEWEGSLIYTFRSGLPFGINGGNGNNNSGSLQAQDRADSVAGTVVRTRQGGKSDWLNQYFTTAAFQQNAVGTFGNTGRNFLQAPGLSYGDLAIIKNWAAHNDRYHIQFRWEMFNAFNHTSFGTPDNTVGSTTFGRITAIGAVAPRVQQAGLKVTF